MSNRPQLIRDAMIKDIVDTYIAHEEDCLGQIVADSFPVLEQMVANLACQGRSRAWKNGIEEWRNKILYAYKAFCDQNGFSHLQSINYDELTTRTQRDFACALKWAVMMGAIDAYKGNR